jgi:hypothetical protein
MKYHVLNGDALAEKFPVNEIPGEIIVIREAFIEGPISKDFSEEYWGQRMEFIQSSYHATTEEYSAQFISQLPFLDSIQDGDEVFLWFEDDLFCVVNMLFVIAYVSGRSHPDFYRIFPNADNKMWSGFARATSDDLMTFFESKTKLDADEVELSNQLWQAYVDDDREKLSALSFSDTDCFRFLPEVIQAHLDQKTEDGNPGRPIRSLIEIMNQGITNFYEIFDAFNKGNAIYGYGDLQVYNMLKKMGVMPPAP